MPANKKQHYVPKHILKRFAPDEHMKQVNLIHIPSARVIWRASLRDQCYRDYFYGTEVTVEKALSGMESVQSRLVDKIAADGRIEATDRSEISLLFTLQRARTLRAESETSGMMEALMKLAMFGKFDEETLRSVKIGMTEGPRFNVATALRMSHLLDDLQQTLIVNRSDAPFVVSDSPVVSTNWFCRVRYPHKNSPGYAMAGLQMLMPITPTLALLMVDDGVYHVDAPRQTLVLTKRRDVQYLNSLQWLNALNAVYFTNAYDQDCVQELLSTTGREPRLFRMERAERLTGKDFYTVTKKDEYAAPSDGVISELVNMSSPPLARDIRVPGLSMRQKKTFFDDGSLASPMRDPVWVEIVEDFGQLMEANSVSFSDFADFVSWHHLEPKIGKWRKRVLLRAQRDHR